MARLSSRLEINLPRRAVDAWVDRTKCISDTLTIIFSHVLIFLSLHSVPQTSKAPRRISSQMREA